MLAAVAETDADLIVMGSRGQNMARQLLKRDCLKRGVATLCIGGGPGIARAIEMP